MVQWPITVLIVTIGIMITTVMIVTIGIMITTVTMTHHHLAAQVDTMSFGSSAQKGCYCALSTAASHGQRKVFKN